MQAKEPTNGKYTHILRLAVNFMKRTIFALAFLLLVCQLAFPQDSEKLTVEDKRAAQELSDAVTKSFDETGDITPVVNELFVSDFIERYLAAQKRKFEPDDARILFVSGIEYKYQLLDQAPKEDWKRFFILTRNFMNYGFNTTLNKISKYYLSKKTPPDEVLDNLYPPEVVKLFDGHPILKDFIQRKGTNKPIGTPKELKSVNDTLEQALKLLSAKKNPLSPDAKKVLKILAEKPDEEGNFAVDIDDERYGFPKETRLITFRAGLYYRFFAAKIGGAYKIVWLDYDLGD